MANRNLSKARVAKNDEFYTQISDIEKEVKLYKKQFEGKTIFMNCDDPEWSNFWRYFHNNFGLFGLKKIISTHYEADKKSYKLEYDGKEIVKTDLLQNGDFRSPESIELLKEADIVVTNPPFSLFREYIDQLMTYKKKFLIIGSKNSIGYKEVFPLIKSNQIWLGVNSAKEFVQPDGTVKKFGNIGWYTNLKHNRSNELIGLARSINDPDISYQKYDNYDAINVNKVADIPKDYDGVMGVPISFLDRYNPEQFEIVTMGIGEHNFTPTKKYGRFYDPVTKAPTNHKRDYLLYIRDEDGKYLTDEGYRINKVYTRILIKRRQNENNKD